MSARTWEAEGQPQPRQPEESRRKRRRDQKVHRGSKPSGWAASFSRRFHGGKAALKRLLDAVSFYADRLPREARAAYGEITAKYLRVYRELVLFWVKSKDGLVEPSGVELAYKSRCGPATVWRALEVLERHGFLERLRRFRPARSGEAGRWEQDKNAYRILTPEVAENLVDAPHDGLDMRKVPPPRPRPRRTLPALPPNLTAGNVILALGEQFSIPAETITEALETCGLTKTLTMAMIT